MFTALGIFALVVPPVLMLSFKHKVIAFVGGMLVFWLAMAAIAAYTLASVPEYDSMGAGIIIFFGWIHGGVYCLFWLGLGKLFRKLAGCLRRSQGDL